MYHRLRSLLLQEAPSTLAQTSEERHDWTISPDHVFPPYEGTSQYSTWWTRIWYSYGNKLIEAGWNHPIQISDLHDLPVSMHVDSYISDISERFHVNKERYDRYAFGRALLGHHWKAYVVRMIQWKFTITLFSVIRPFILHALLDTVTSLATSTSTSSDSGENLLILTALFWGVLLSFASLVQAMIMHAFYFIGVQSALSARGAVISVLFRKAMTVDYIARNEHSAALSNLASVDADNIMMFLWATSHELYASPIMILINVLGLLMMLGYTAFVGITLLIMSLLCTTKLTRIMRSLQLYMMERADERVRRVSELLSSMKIIKVIT
jgi:ABC-type bacteriocin/lantibiotic exporter with double-glycine peptidase domain